MADVNSGVAHIIYNTRAIGAHTTNGRVLGAREIDDVRNRFGRRPVIAHWALYLQPNYMGHSAVSAADYYVVFTLSTSFGMQHMGHV